MMCSHFSDNHSRTFTMNFSATQVWNNFWNPYFLVVFLSTIWYSAGCVWMGKNAKLPSWHCIYCTNVFWCKSEDNVFRYYWKCWYYSNNRKHIQTILKDFIADWGTSLLPFSQSSIRSGLWMHINVSLKCTCLIWRKSNHRTESKFKSWLSCWVRAKVPCENSSSWHKWMRPRFLTRIRQSRVQYA